MWKQSPVFGVGQRQFIEHHYMTAHNSYVLSLAELGLIGMVLFISMLVLTVKTLVIGVRELDRVPGAKPAQAWALGLLASFVGMMFSINTLSFCWHSVLWIFLGLGGAWVSVVRTHKPDFEVKLTVRDVAFIALGCAAYQRMNDEGLLEGIDVLTDESFNNANNAIGDWLTKNCEG